MTVTLVAGHEASRQHRRGTCSCSRQPDLALQRRKDRAAGRWPFGGPSLRSVQRWTRDLWKAGMLERTVEHTGKPGRPPYRYRWIGPKSGENRTVSQSIADERVVTILRRAKGKALTEDQILARYKEAMARRDKAALELEQASLSGARPAGLPTRPERAGRLPERSA